MVESGGALMTANIIDGNPLGVRVYLRKGVMVGKRGSAMQVKIF